MRKAVASARTGVAVSTLSGAYITDCDWDACIPRTCRIVDSGGGLARQSDYARDRERRGRVANDAACLAAGVYIAVYT